MIPFDAILVGLLVAYALMTGLFAAFWPRPHRTRRYAPRHVRRFHFAS